MASAWADSFGIVWGNSWAAGVVADIVPGVHLTDLSQLIPLPRRAEPTTHTVNVRWKRRKSLSLSVTVSYILPVADELQPDLPPIIEYDVETVPTYIADVPPVVVPAAVTRVRHHVSLGEKKRRTLTVRVRAVHNDDAEALAMLMGKM